MNYTIADFFQIAVACFVLWRAGRVVIVAARNEFLPLNLPGGRTFFVSGLGRSGLLLGYAAGWLLWLGGLVSVLVLDSDWSGLLFLGGMAAIVLGSLLGYLLTRPRPKLVETSELTTFSTDLGAAMSNLEQLMEQHQAQERRYPQHPRDGYR